MAENPLKGLGLKRIVFLAGGALVVFVISALLHLYVCGVLNLASPHLRPVEGYAAVDSILASWAESEEAREPVGTEASAARPPGTEAGSPESEERTGETDRPVGTNGSAENREGTSNTEAPEEGGTEEAGAVPPEVDTTSPQAKNTESSADPTGLSEPGSGQSAAEEIESLLPFDESKLSRLVRVYEKMRPKQVAVILTTMQDRQVVTILSHMKENKAAQILGEMEPGKAARISQTLMNWGTYER